MHEMRPSKIVTYSTIRRELSTLGLMEGDIVCVHSSLSALGHVIGGSRAIVQSLLDVVGPQGTIMMMAFSGDLSDPAEWKRPPVPPELWATIREELPAYDANLTPSRNVGVVAEFFRHYPGAQRSSHPQSSMVALGASASELVQPHPLDNRFGRESPLARLVEYGGKVLLLGAPDRTISLFHYTQHLVGWSTPVQKSAPIIENGRKIWAQYTDIEYPTDWFQAGFDFLLNNGYGQSGAIGQGRVILFDAAAIVDTLVQWRKKTGS